MTIHDRNCVDIGVSAKLKAKLVAASIERNQTVTSIVEQALAPLLGGDHPAVRKRIRRRGKVGL